MSVETIEKTFSCPDSPHLTLSQKDDGSVKINTRYDHKGFRFFRNWYPCKVDYTVLVPKECSLKVRGVSNSATIEGILGEVDISSVSGGIECRSLMGQIKIKTVSGDVQGEALSGSARLNAVSGDINLKNSDFPALRGKTVSGDLVIETPLGDGPYEFNSVSGDIKLDISPVDGATVSSSSISGDVRTSLPLSHTNQSRNHRRFEIKGGGVEINHSSISGDLILDGENNNGASEIESEEGPSLDRSPTRTDILGCVDSGELSVDQMIAGNSFS
jgi:hypothetical protein